MQTWEYAIVRWDQKKRVWWCEPLLTASGSLFEVFTGLGEQGWELCVVHPGEHFLIGRQPLMDADNYFPPEYYFKRPG